MNVQHRDFLWPIRVYWEDTDAGGIVFYANYLKFFERARSEWLRSLGIQQQALRHSTGGMFVVGATELRYLRSAQLDDALCVRTRVQQAGRATLVLAQSAWRDANEGAVCLCEGTIRIGWVDAATLKPGRIPLTILERLSKA